MNNSFKENKRQWTKVQEVTVFILGTAVNVDIILLMFKISKIRIAARASTFSLSWRAAVIEKGWRDDIDKQCRCADVFGILGQQL